MYLGRVVIVIGASAIVSAAYQPPPCARSSAAVTHRCGFAAIHGLPLLHQ